MKAREILDKLRAHAPYARLSAYFVVFSIILAAESIPMWHMAWLLSIICIIMALVALYTAFNIAYFRVFEYGNQ
jgi:hypothetical protein